MSVGRHPWNGGELILSRWDKPVEIVPWERVADDWVAEFRNRGVEFDIVPPKLLPILAERGVEILPPHKGMGKACKDAYEAWKNEHPGGPKGGVQAEGSQYGGMDGIRFSLSQDAIKNAEDLRNDIEYQKKVSDATERIEKRLAELHRHDGNEQSLTSDEGLASIRVQDNEPTSPLNGGDSGVAQSIANLYKKIKPANEIAEKSAKFIADMEAREDVDASNYARELARALEVNELPGNSQYAHFETRDGERVTIRVSDHNGKARNIIINGVRTKRGVSIVLETPDSPDAKFKATKWAKVDEYIYENPDKQRLIDITKSIFGLFDSGEFVDLANADGMYLYKQDETSGQKQFSLSEKEREAQTHSDNFKRWFGDWETIPRTPARWWTRMASRW